jgi:hypothetical protein
MAIASVSRVRRKIKTSNQCKKGEKITTYEPVKRTWKIFAFKGVFQREGPGTKGTLKTPIP